jgi:hypothetical protein
MPRARVFKYLVCLGMLCSPSFWLHAQPLIGQVIEQAKRSKLLELMPAPVPEATVPGRRVAAAAARAEPPTPVLWSLSGLNRLLTAELLIGEQIHPVRIATGASIPGGWSIVEADVDSLTIQNGKKMVTLYPAAPGTAGGQFAALRPVRRSDSDSLQGIQESLNSRGIPVEFINPEPIRPTSTSRPPPGIDAARQAAGALPSKP